jgi:hypothetical protein
MNKDDFGILPIFDRKESKLLRKTLNFSLGAGFSFFADFSKTNFFGDN